MKTILSILVSFFTFAANADTIASYEFGRKTSESFYKGEVVSVFLDEDSTLTVMKRPVEFQVELPEIPEIIGFKKLHKTNYQRLLSDIILLSNAKIEEQKFGAVCEIFVPVWMYTNHLKVAREYDNKEHYFAGGMELVNSPVGCWTGHNVYPSDKNAQAVATRLKMLLEVIALEMVSAKK